jgi:hypothetical protein
MSDYKTTVALLLALEALLKGKRGQEAEAARKALDEALVRSGHRYPENTHSW